MLAGQGYNSIVFKMFTYCCSYPLFQLHDSIMIRNTHSKRVYLLNKMLTSGQSMYLQANVDRQGVGLALQRVSCLHTRFLWSFLSVIDNDLANSESCLGFMFLLLFQIGSIEINKIKVLRLDGSHVSWHLSRESSIKFELLFAKNVLSDHCSCPGKNLQVFWEVSFLQDFFKYVLHPLFINQNTVFTIWLFLSSLEVFLPTCSSAWFC